MMTHRIRLALLALVLTLTPYAVSGHQGMLLLGVGGPAAGGGSPPFLNQLIAYYAHDEASGNLVDQHTSGLTLTETGTMGASTGKKAGARNYSTIGYAIRPGDDAGFSTGDVNFTSACWVNSSSIDSLGITVGKDTGGQREYGGYVASDGIFHWFVFDVSDNGTDIVWGSAMVASTWYFVLMGHDADNNQTFLSVNDGTRVTGSHSTGVRDGTNAFALGARSDGTLLFSGSQDECGFWKRFLTTAEGTYLYNSGTGRDWSEVSTYVP